VPDERLPLLTSDIEQEHVKLGTYLSFKWITSANVDVDISLYHQAKIDELISAPRLASSSSIKYNVTKNLGLILRYQNSYEYDPMVPIDKL
jgi:hypothetical protein